MFLVVCLIFHLSIFPEGFKVDRDVPDGAGGGGAEGSQCWRGQFYFISNSLLYNLEGEFYLNTSTLYNLGGEQLLWTNFHFLLLPSRLLPSEGSSSLRNLMNIFISYFCS